MIDSERASALRKSPYLISPVLHVFTDSEVYGVQGIEVGPRYCELWQSEKEIYAILWLSLYTGFVIDYCPNDFERMARLVARLPEAVKGFYAIASISIEPEELNLELAHAGDNLKESINTLKSEAFFLKSKIPAKEIIMVTASKKMRVERARKIHTEVLATLARKVEYSELEAEGKTKKLLDSEVCISEILPNLRGLQNSTVGSNTP